MGGGVTAVLLLGLAASLAAWLAAALGERGLHPFRRRAGSCRRPATELALLALVAAGLVHHGATKVTNGAASPPTGYFALPPAHASALSAPAAPAPEYAAHAVTNADWLAFGGFGDWFTVPEGGWCFRFGTGLVERVTVFASGEIRAAPHDASNRMSVLGVPLSIAPAANWRLLPDGRGSLFWHAETPSNTLLLTWRDALIGRDAARPVTVRAELFPDGAAELRYRFSDAGALPGASARVWRDGVEEEVPVAPEGGVACVALAAPAPPPADTPGAVLARIAGGSNAYYFAEVALAKGPARIEVRCDGDSALGGYAVMAEAGATNRLPLLVGPRYEVEAETAFSHFALAPSELETPLSRPAATNVTDRLAEVRWPVSFALEEVAADADGATYALRVAPDGLEGEVAWDGAPPLRTGGGARLRSGGGGCACGCQSFSTNTVSHASSCACDDCTASGGYVYEGHVERFEVHFPGDTGGDEPPGPGGGEGGDDPPETPASVGVSFEKPVVIFEDRHESSPGVFVERQSTTTKLTVTAYGGPNGGTLDVQIGGGLREVPGSDPRPTEIGAQEEIEWVAYCEATNASPCANGAFATVTFTDLESGETDSTTANATAVEVEIRENQSAPEGNCPLRHVYGVRETIQCWQLPTSPQLTWTVTGDGSNYWTGVINKYFCPLQPENDPIKASIGDVEYTPLISVIPPQNVQAMDARRKNYGPHPNEAGWVGMEFEYYVLPKYVSFSGIAIEEVPCQEGMHDGHFSNPYFSNIWAHTRANGAGRWHDVGADNLFATDSAQIGEAIPKIRPDGQVTFDTDGEWTNGNISWNMPFGWNEKGTRGETPQVGTFAEHVRQDMAIFFDGRSGVRKFTHQLVRTTNDVFTLNGVVIP